MTTKEIAEATGKAEKTVRTWAKKTAAKSAAMTAKIADSSSSYPADYDIAETCQIIETGMGKNAADLFRMSVKEKPSSDMRIDRLENMVEKLCIAVATIPQTIQSIAGQQKQIAFIQDYYSIKGYASKIGQQLNFSDALNLGRIAGKLSREKSIEIRKVDDESFGQVNSYNIAILEEVFQI